MRSWKWWEMNRWRRGKELGDEVERKVSIGGEGEGLSEHVR